MQLVSICQKKIYNFYTAFYFFNFDFFKYTIKHNPP